MQKIKNVIVFIQSDISMYFLSALSDRGLIDILINDTDVDVITNKETLKKYFRKGYDYEKYENYND